MINLNNYETFFILYVDNELSPSEKVLVEDFATQHGLQKELDIFLTAALPAEFIEFVPKTMLYKNAGEVESVQESLLLYVDDELATVDKRVLLAQVAGNPLVNDELQLLQKVKLESEVISFPFKAELYRHNANVYPIKFWRSIAAILIGVGLFVTFTIEWKQDKGSSTENVAVVAPTMQKEALSIGGETAESKQDIVAPNAGSVALKAVEMRPAASSNIVGAKEKGFFPEPALKNKEKIVTNSVVTIRQPRVKENVVSLPLKSVVALTTEAKNIQQPLTQQNTLASTFAAIPDDNTTMAMLPVGKNNDQIFLMDEEKISRSKVGTLFRKVKRIVERNAKIQTPNGIRIGGFEIALK
ncbi:MAG: hypothetical protein ABIO05_03460 [Ferruginibacter sp.]